MQTASKLFTDESRRRINAAVAEAESKTSAEIVPVVASCSGRYDRAEDMAGLWLAIAALIVSWLLFQRVDDRGWEGPSIGLGLAALLAILVIAFIVGAALASRIGWLRKLFTMRGDMRAEVNARARQMFFDQRVHHTAAGTGVLIYVSLHERMAAILADETVIEKLGLPAIEDLCKQLTERLKGGDIAEALAETIKNVGDRLAQALPASATTANELADALVTVD